MTQVKITYNPFKLLSEIEIDGQPVANNSCLTFPQGLHLQEWVDDLPQKLIEECGTDNGIDVLFHGTKLDYEDVQESLANSKAAFNLKYEPSIIIQEDREAKITQLFEKITQGPIEELKNPAVIDAFEKAKGTEFPINVVATMSAGKSTLINALLGKKLMPAQQEACTAVITKIVDNDKDQYTAEAYDKKGKVIEHSDQMNYAQMKEWNSNSETSTINMFGDIPFVRAEEGQTNLVLIDTPGPNNARNPEHQKTTRKALNGSSKTLIIYVMNATQLSTRDDYELFSKIKQSIQDGKQARDRFLFVINKLDTLDVDEENVAETLTRVRSYLQKNLGIENPNIYPASALLALNLRNEFKNKTVDAQAFMKFYQAKDNKAIEIMNRISTANDNEDHHFERFASLPPMVKQALQAELKSAQENVDLKQQALIHSGIPAIESAIKIYVEKYALPNKISNIVATFEAILEKNNAIFKIKQALQENEQKRIEFQKEIAGIETKLNSIKTAQGFQKRIEKIDFSQTTKSLIDQRIKQSLKEYQQIIGSLDKDDYSPDDARKHYDQICGQFDKMKRNLEVDLEELTTRSITQQVKELEKEYLELTRNVLSDSQVLVGLKIDPLSFSRDNVKQSIKQLKIEQVKKHQDAIFVNGVTWYKPWTWFRGNEKVKEARDYVLKEDLIALFIPVQEELEKYKADTKNYIKYHQIAIRKTFEKEINKLNEKLIAELSALKDVKSASNETSQELDQQKQNLKWLEEVLQELQTILAI